MTRVTKTPDEIETDAHEMSVKWTAGEMTRFLRNYRLKLRNSPQAIEVTQRAIEIRKTMDKVAAGIDKDKT